MLPLPAVDPAPGGVENPLHAGCASFDFIIGGESQRWQEHVYDNAGNQAKQVVDEGGDHKKNTT
jgi:hypothetical protein